MLKVALIMVSLRLPAGKAEVATAATLESHLGTRSGDDFHFFKDTPKNALRQTRECSVK